METSPLSSTKNKRRVRSLLAAAIVVAFAAASIGGIIFSLPLILASNIAHLQIETVAAAPEQFPVTVDPHNKVIVENDAVNAFLDGPNSPMQAAAWNVQNTVAYLFDWIATAIASIPWYQNLGAVDGRFVTIDPGMRKEQVANAFAKALGWNDEQKQAFLDPTKNNDIQISEGTYAPGVYLVSSDATPETAQTMVRDRFYKDVASHYGTTTAQTVPLSEALTVASLIERESGGPDDMRLISGIIWNRLFINMRLQIDATVQYAKANAVPKSSWWPRVVPPGDIARKSPYNTYLNAGLPPGPIANPSVAAILAALNPKQTSCLFYFHDANHVFHCSETYEEHVALLKKYYGRGK